MRKDVSLGGEAIRLTASKIITLLISLINTMLLSRIRTFVEYGTYSQLLLVIQLAVSLFMLGLPNCINYFMGRADSSKEKRYFLSVYYTLSTIFSVIIGLILVLSIPIIEVYFHNSLVRDFYFFLALYPWTNIITSSISNILVVYRRTSVLIVYNIIHSISMIAPVILVHLMGLSFRTYMIAFTWINCLYAIIVYVIVYKLSGGIGFLLSKTLIKEVLRFSVPMGLAAAVGTLNTEIDKFLIGYLMDTEQLAIYTNAARELPLSIIASSITAVLLPQIARLLKDKKSEKAILLWGSAIELAMIIIALVVFGVFTYAEEAMTFLYSDKYLPGVTVFRIYTLNLLLRTTYFGMILNASGQSRKIFLCSVLSLLFNAILNPCLYYLFGMPGPAIATFLAIMIITLLQLYLTSKVLKIKFFCVFPWKNVTNILLINIAFSIVFGIAKRILPIEIVIGEVSESLLLGMIWATIYLGVMRKSLLDKWNVLNS